MEYILETQNLTKIYGQKEAARDVNIHIREGQIYGLIGRNGAGKTTIMRMISGLSTPTRGDYTLFGKTGREKGKMLKNVGVLIEHPGLYPRLSAYENIKIKCIGMGLNPKGPVEELLRTVGLENTDKRKAAGSFSLGMRQRLGIALALVGDGSDPFGRIRHWWNTGRLRYDTPMQHLTDALGLGREPEEGVHAVGKGFVAILRVHPAQIAYDAETEEHYAALLRECRRRMNRPAFREKNYFALRRGPYVIAAAMADSAATESFSLKGRFVRLDRPELPVVDEIAPKGGEYVLAADLDRYEPAVCLVGSAGRVEDYSLTEGCLTFSVHGPTGARCALRFKGPRPARVELNGADTPFEYDAFGGTFLIRLAGDPDGARVVVTWPSA